MRKNSDLILRFNNISMKFQELYSEYQAFFKIAQKELINYEIKITDSFMVYAVKYAEDELSNETWEVIKKDADRIKSMKQYSIYNTLAVLRILTRKIKTLEARNWHFKARIRSLLKEVKKLEEDALSRPWIEDEFSTINGTEEVDIKETLLRWEKIEFDSKLNVFDFIFHLFIDDTTLSKQEFLQVITIAKDKKYWDGSKAIPYSEIVKDIPDQIDFETFKKLIFRDKIEDDKDCYLFDIFMEKAAEHLERITKETGRSPAFEFLSEISEAPLQTYSAEFDEYGDVISMKLNKPNLRAIEGGKVND